MYLNIFSKFTIIFLIFFTFPTYGADTIEPFDIGVTDYEFYMNLKNINNKKCKNRITGESVIGIGLTKRISTLVTYSIHTNEYFSSKKSDFSIGGFGNILNSKHVDLDLIFIAGSDGSLNPALELNLDLKDDLKSAGLYFYGGELISGENFTYSGGKKMKSKRKYSLPGKIGAYYTISEKAQLLFEFNFEIKHFIGKDEKTFNTEGFAIGFNIKIHPTIEIINQAFIDIPQNNKKPKFSFMTGLIITIP
jgi:hypothetical protein